MAQSAKDILIIELKDMISDLREDNKSLRLTLDKNTSEIASLRELLLNAQEENKYLRKMIFGTKSEKRKVIDYDENQMTIFDLLDIEQPTPSDLEGDVADDKSDAVIIKEHTRKPKTSLEEKLKKLPFEEVEIPLEGDDLLCKNCGTELTRIGREYIRQEVIYTKPEIKVIKYYSVKYKCPECDKTAAKSIIYKSEVPKGLLKHCYISASVLSEIMYQKVCNSVPLYRQEKDWTRYGLELSRATMANLIISCSDLYLLPIYERCHHHLLNRTFAMADETRLQVLKEPERRPQTDSFMWLFRSGNDGEPPIILYKYHETRNGDNARAFLKGFNGYLMTDGFSGYNKLSNLNRCCCYAHLRRYFIDAIPAGKENDLNEPAVQGRVYIDKLFDFERRYKEKGYSFEKIKERRLKDEKPVIEAFLAWLDIQIPRKGSRLAKALTYANNRRPYMFTYLEDGRCSLHNNDSEQMMKSYVTGRKNWLFADSTKGADALAICYSMVEMAKANELDASKYLEFLLKSQPTSDMSPSELDELLPWSTKAKQACSLK